MKVFVSWSGEPSRSIATAPTEWLRNVVQHVDPWMSDEKIGSGARWNDAIAEALGETNFGIVCVTRANQHAPWLIFEAGALAKSVGTEEPEGGSIPIGPVYFTKDYVERGSNFDKTYPQGSRGVVLREHTRLGRVTHIDLRLSDGEFLLKVPIDYIRTD